MKDKDTKRLASEKTQIEALIEKHRPHTPKTPDEVNTSGTGKNANTDGQEGTEKVKPPHKKATKDNQIKMFQKKGEKANKVNPDTLLGDPVVHTTTCKEKAKEKGQKDKVGIDDIGIFEFIFHGLPNLPELEGMDEDRLRELQNAIQLQLCQRDKERERNITKRVQEFEKTFDFVNSHLLKGVVTMAELTKTDNRQPMGKIKPTDKMVMMPSLFDSTKLATSKQHYERFNLYINFQTKSGHLTDLVREAIDLFKHMLEKTALVWFQINRSTFKDLTMLKMMFLQRYNPWGKTKREQLQSWNILSFDPKNTDVDEHIDLINTLGNMVDQKEEAKKEKFIEAMSMMIQTHLIICKDWADIKDKAKSLEHIIGKCDPPTPRRQMKFTQMRALTIIITMIITLPQVRVEAADILMVKAVTDNLEVSHNETEAKDLSIVNISFRIIDIREVHPNRTLINTAITINPIFREIKQIAAEAKAMTRVLSNSQDVVVVGPIIRVAMEHTSISITCMTHRQNSMAHLAVYAVVLIILLSIATRENMI